MEDGWWEGRRREGDGGGGASVDKIWTALATSGRATAIKCIRKWPQLARSGTDIWTSRHFGYFC